MTLISENVETQVRDSRYEQVEEQSQASYDIKKFFESCLNQKSGRDLSCMNWLDENTVEISDLSPYVIQQLVLALKASTGKNVHIKKKTVISISNN
ncbi:hypothetical protein N9C06_03570 [Salibacteraceae bacterium]|jgi:hypothetical protein|nr:hypothetical protein [Salibacteraceae bacterium]